MAMKNEYKRYNLVLTLLVGIALLSIGLTNFLVDPYGLYQGVSFATFGKYREQSSKRI